MWRRLGALLAMTSALIAALSLTARVPFIHASESARIEGRFDIGGRKIFIACRGAGEPTIVFEPGQGVEAGVWSPMVAHFSTRTRACTYDRANRGKSDSAPTPRTATAMVQDLERLLRAADVPSPYLLVGHSAGGELARLFASRNASQTSAFLAINSVPVATVWLPRALPLLTPAQRREELAYYAGQNDENIAWRASGKALAAARPPAGKPYTIMISTIAQCEGEPSDGPCHRTYALYTKLQRALSTQSRKGRFVMLAGQHELYVDHPQDVRREVQKLLSAAR